MADNKDATRVRLAARVEPFNPVALRAFQEHYAAGIRSQPFPMQNPRRKMAAPVEPFDPIALRAFQEHYAAEIRSQPFPMQNYGRKIYTAAAIDMSIDIARMGARMMVRGESLAMSVGLLAIGAIFLYKYVQPRAEDKI